MNVSDEIIKLRRKVGLTQEAFAEKINVSRQAVAKWESGEALPEIEKLITISDLFRITLDSLIKGEQPCALSSDLTPEENLNNFNIKEASRFLCKAKKLTYAANGAELDSSRLASHDLQYEEGKYKYYDSYFGGEKFAGGEVLWISDNPVWSMNYVGRVLGDSFSGDFLKEALGAIPEDAPYRGPELFIKGDYTFHCKVQGEFGWFSGEEAIFYKKERVYECLFHGGYVK